MVTGIETTTAFLHSCRTFTRRWSISKMSATRRSCSRAISNGFSRRWDSGASTVVTGAAPRSKSRWKPAEYRALLDAEPDRSRRGRAIAGRRRDELDAVRAARKHGAVRAASGEAEGDPAGQQV